MTREKALKLNGRFIRAAIELEAMKACNKLRDMQGSNPAYDEYHFLDLIQKHRISEEDVERMCEDD